MSFSFNATANSSQSTAKPRLEGNKIHEVTFDGCESVDIQGVKQPDQVYKVLRLKFSNEDGAYEKTIFEPQEKDFERSTNSFTDKSTGQEKEIPQASYVENMMLLFKHAIDTIVPAIAKEIDEGKRNLGAKDWNDLRNLMVTILNKGKGSTFQIKLITNNKGEAEFPGFFSGINKDGKCYIKNNFIGKKLAFSAYEASKIKNSASAPKSTPSFEKIGVPENFSNVVSSELNISSYDDLPDL